MTSIAVTASIRASTSKAALFVASFMPFSLDLGMTHRLRASACEWPDLYSEHPTTSIRFDESPLSEYRRWKGRSALRREWGSPVAGLCAGGGFFERRRDRPRG